MARRIFMVKRILAYSVRVETKRQSLTVFNITWEDEHWMAPIVH